MEAVDVGVGNLATPAETGLYRTRQEGVQDRQAGERELEVLRRNRNAVLCDVIQECVKIMDDGTGRICCRGNRLESSAFFQRGSVWASERVFGGRIRFDGVQCYSRSQGFHAPNREIFAGCQPILCFCFVPW